jgi:hypothetical protein
MTLFQGSFALLITLAELRRRELLKYIEFLSGRFGKGILLLMVGILVFDDTRSNDLAVGILVVLAGLFNLIVSCMRDERYEERRPLKGAADEEEERYSTMGSGGAEESDELADKLQEATVTMDAAAAGSLPMVKARFNQ